MDDGLDRSWTAAGVFSDLSKVFDSVNHRLLSCKLEYYRIRGFVLDWWQAYLSERSQSVIVIWVARVLTSRYLISVP